MPQCGKCGKPIEFIKMANGKKMPVDAQMVYLRKDPEGLVKAVEVIGMAGRPFNAEYAAPGAPGTIKAFQTHWPNCMQGVTRTTKLSQADWRKRKDEMRTSRPTKSSTHHPHYDPHKKKDQAQKMEQIALF